MTNFWKGVTKQDVRALVEHSRAARIERDPYFFVWARSADDARKFFGLPDRWPCDDVTDVRGLELRALESLEELQRRGVLPRRLFRLPTPAAPMSPTPDPIFRPMGVIEAETKRATRRNVLTLVVVAVVALVVLPHLLLAQQSTWPPTPNNGSCSWDANGWSCDEWTTMWEDFVGGVEFVLLCIASVVGLLW
jgi:hypothetical protein